MCLLWVVSLFSVFGLETFAQKIPTISNDDLPCLEDFIGCDDSSTSSGCAAQYCNASSCGCSAAPPGYYLHFACQCDSDGCRRVCQHRPLGS